MELDIHETENALLNKLHRVLGAVPIGTRGFLNVLTHPDVIDYTEEYVRYKRQKEFDISGKRNKCGEGIKVE